MKTILLGSILTLIAVVPMRAAEEELPLTKLPPNVQEAIKTLVGKGQITKTVKEKGDAGGTIYEVSYTLNNRKYEAEISPEAKVLVVDQQITIGEAPKAVQKVIEEKTAGGK